jgi:hypothetical protein
MTQHVVGAIVFCFGVVLLAAELSAQDEIIFAELGGVQLVSIPQPSPGDGFRATIIQVRAADPSHEVVTFENLSIIGNAHHVWPERELPQEFDAYEFAKLPEPDSTYPVEWLSFDSHILLTYGMIGESNESHSTG